MDIATTKALIAGLFTWLNLHAGLPIPASAPEIAATLHPALERMACTGPCSVLGFYPDNGVIYLDARLVPQTNLCARSVLLHELVHYVQHVEERFAGESPAVRWQLREIEAHRAQTLFLASHGRRIVLGRFVVRNAFIGPRC